MAKYNNKTATTKTQNTEKISKLVIPVGMDKAIYAAEHEKMVKLGVSADDARVFAAAMAVEGGETVLVDTAKKKANTTKNAMMGIALECVIPGIAAIGVNLLGKIGNEFPAEIEKLENAARKIFTARKLNGGGIGGPKATSPNVALIFSVDGENIAVTKFSGLRHHAGRENGKNSLVAIGGYKPEREFCETHVTEYVSQVAISDIPDGTKTYTAKTMPENLRKIIRGT